MRLCDAAGAAVPYTVAVKAPSDEAQKRASHEKISVVRVVAVRCAPSVGFCPAGDWPQFRGPGGAAVSDETGLPVKWSATENVRWKAELPGRGVSSPVIAGGRVYVTAASATGNGVCTSSASMRPAARSYGSGSSPPPAAPCAIPKRAWPRRRR